MIMQANGIHPSVSGLDAIAQALAGLEKSLSRPKERTIAELTAMEAERRRLKSEFSRLVREAGEQFESVKNDLNALRTRCDPYVKVEKNIDRSGISFMDGDQVLQRSRNLIQTLRFSTGDTDNLARLWREYRRLAARFNTLAASGMFPSAILRDNAKDALKRVGEQLQIAMDSGEDYTKYNTRILKALIKRYGGEAKAREVMRTTDGGELLRIMREEEAKSSYSPQEELLLKRYANR